MINIIIMICSCVLIFALSMILSYALFTHRARKEALRKRRNALNPEKKEKKKGLSTSFSKKMLILFSANSLVLTGMTIVVSFTHYDPTALSVVTAASYCVDGTWGGFYLWKSKNENRAKYAQEFIREFADKYGIDAAIRVAEVVLKE